MQNWFDLLRVAIPVILIFGLFPALAARCGDRWPVPVTHLLVPAFLRTALFLELTCLLLGNWRLCLPGMLFVFYAVWIIAATVLASRKRWLYNPESWKFGYGWLLRWWEKGMRPRGVFDRDLVISQGYLFLGMLVVGAFLRFLWQPLFNLRFLTAQGYESTLSLQALVSGALWISDGSVALLAPIVFASGLDAATVVRLSAPLVFLMMLGALAYCMSQFSASAWASTLAVGLFWLYSRSAGFEEASATGGSLWSSLFLILGLAAGRKSAGYAACGLLLAWLCNPAFPELFFVALVCGLAGLLFQGFLSFAPRRMRQIAQMVLVLAAGLSLTVPLKSIAADGPLQYESSAQTANRIAREFPRNRWLMVSPMHEVAFSYGRGWHVELPHFLSQFPQSTVADPAFRFPYSVRDIFVFVEKRPLRQVASLAVPGNGEHSFYYSTNGGRASMAFRAAELIAAYSASHPETSVYFEDQELIVYHLRQ